MTAVGIKVTQFHSQPANQFPAAKGAGGRGEAFKYIYIYIYIFPFIF
jgi:hypothetical protein